MDSWVPFGRLRDREIICSISTLGAVVGVGVDITNQQIPSMYGIVNYIWLFLRENVLVYIYIPYMDGLGMESGLVLRFRVKVLGFQKMLRLIKTENVRIVMSKWAKDCMFFPTKWPANKQLAGVWPKQYGLSRPKNEDSFTPKIYPWKQTGGSQKWWVYLGFVFEVLTTPPVKRGFFRFRFRKHSFGFVWKVC